MGRCVDCFLFVEAVDDAEGDVALVYEGVFVGVENDAFGGGQDFLFGKAFVGIEDLGKGLVVADVFSGGGEAAVEAGGSCVDVGEVFVLDYVADVATVAFVADDSHAGEEAQDGSGGADGAFFVEFVGFVGVDAESGGGLVLPVVVEGFGVHGAGFADHYIGKAEQVRQGRALEAGFHHSDMGDEFSGHVKAGKLDAVGVIADLFQHSGGYPGGGVAFLVSGEAAVDVNVAYSPKTFAGVDGKRVDGGNYHDFFVGVDAAFIFQFLELFYQLGADVELLDFISAYGPCNAGGFFAFSKAVSLHQHVFSVVGFHPK